jgi:hypothetical protein
MASLFPCRPHRAHKARPTLALCDLMQRQPSAPPVPLWASREIRSYRQTQTSVKFGCDLDLPNDCVVEGAKVVRRDPILKMSPRAHLLYFIGIQERALHLEPRYPAAAAWRVPVSCNLNCIGFIQDGIEDRLLRQAWRESAPARSFNQSKFGLTNRTPKRYRFRRIDHRAADASPSLCA